MIKKLKKYFCSHEFDTAEITRTGISPPPEPNRDDYRAWNKWYLEFYTSDYVTKRVYCSCEKCGAHFYANCGLDLPGKLIRSNTA